MDIHPNTSGTVRSAGLAAPLNGVKLIWEGIPGICTQLTETGEQGTWKLDEPPGEGKVTFIREGYMPKTYPADSIPKRVRLLEHDLIGYHDKLWYQPGETIRARVHAVHEFSARLFRHGQKKEEVLNLGEYPASPRQVPDSNFTDEGLDWEPSFSYQTPGDAKPGLYSLLLESEGYRPFAIPYVVSTPPARYGQSKILVLASTNNWQSYNIWGGRSRYRNYEDQSSDDFLREPGKITEWLASAGRVTPRPIVRAAKKLIGMEQRDAPWKFKRLSIKRPLTNAALEQHDPNKAFTNHLAAGEWRVLAWLEREGFEYDIVTGFELHQDPDLLQHYDGIILSTHSEYWSQPMYEGLKKFHQVNGLWIINLSGNSIYREVDFFSDGSHRCTSLKFEESVEDETQILGVRFTEADYGTCAPYRVTDEKHWIFDGCSLENDELFGKESLNRMTLNNSPRYNPGRPGIRAGLKGEGASGWETDKLSRTAPSDFVRVAKGENKWGGADMVVRDPEHTRGGVFSASSITFGGSLLIDRKCSQIVKNVLNRI